VVAAVWSGRVADRIGLGRVIFFCSFVYGGGLLAGGWAREWHDWYYGLIFPVAIAGGAVMTQAWGLLFKLMPAKHRGAISGLATTTKGVGLIVGPLLAGGAIDLAAPYLRATGGYQVLWPVCALPILAVIPLVGRLMRLEAATGRPLPES
jgi:MFS family permease